MEGVSDEITSSSEITSTEDVPNEKSSIDDFSTNETSLFQKSDATKPIQEDLLTDSSMSDSGRHTLSSENLSSSENPPEVCDNDQECEAVSDERGIEEVCNTLSEHSITSESLADTSVCSSHIDKGESSETCGGVEETEETSAVSTTDKDENNEADIVSDRGISDSCMTDKSDSDVREPDSSVPKKSTDLPDEHSSSITEQPLPSVSEDQSTDEMTVQSSHSTDNNNPDKQQNQEPELPKESIPQENEIASQENECNQEFGEMQEKTERQPTVNESPDGKKNSSTDKPDEIIAEKNSDKSPIECDTGNTEQNSEKNSQKSPDYSSLDESQNVEVSASNSEKGNKCTKEGSNSVKTRIDEIQIETQNIGDKIRSDEVQDDSDEQNKSMTDSDKKNTSFEQVNLEKETDNYKEDTNKAASEVDPIASEFVSTNSEEQSEESEQNAEEGADAELCIIPDTERVISQAEKDAASALPTLKDLTATTNTTDSSKSSGGISSAPGKYVISKYDKGDTYTCLQCLLDRTPKYSCSRDGNIKYICDDCCLEKFKSQNLNDYVHSGESGEIRVKNLTSCKEAGSLSFQRKCGSCGKKADNPDVNLTWEIMDFCNEFCLSKYQREIGSRCSSCSTEVRPNSLGKYCVRFGNDIRQFCTSHCLEEYKKGLKVCSYCQQDISKGTDSFLAPVGDRGHFKDFCSQSCMEKYDIMTNDHLPKVDPGTKCFVCNKTDKPIAIDFFYNDQANYFCSEPCFVAFCFVNKIAAGKCAMCRRNFTRKTLEKHTMFYDNIQHSFCSNSCRNIYIIAHRKIVPCNWCKVKKYNFDMIRRYHSSSEVLNMCSVNCYSLYQVSANAVASKKITCDCCLKTSQPMYHLTMSDATIRNFCSYACVMTFQSQFPKAPITINSSERIPIVPAGTPKRSKRLSQSNRQEEDGGMPVISSVQSLATPNGNITPANINSLPTRTTRSKSSMTNSQPVVNNIVDAQSIITQIKQQLIVKPYPIPEQRNVGTMVRPKAFNKGTQSEKPETCNKEVQTEKRAKDKILIPVPVPIYVPSPMHMFSSPAIIPVPIPLPIPIPIFIPTTRNSANGIMKEIKKIQVKIPSDPYEAELLMMAEMVADDKKEDHTDSESDMDDTGAGGDDGHFSPEPVDASNTFGDDMLQMALKMATELDEPAVDLEGALTANTITAPQSEGVTNEEQVDESQPLHLMERQAMRGRKRGMRQGRHHTASKRGRRVSTQSEMPIMTPVQPPPPPEPAEKPDANMCLKYTFGVNAWKQWVTTKNSELEKSSRRVKLFKTEILQLTADELNYSLCLFVKEVRKPNGAEYAPDTIYYLCLGIQQYLFENGRIDNIFCDPYYEKFTDCLDEVARKFSVLYNDSHYIVTRVEEEHLWESKQLGAHSPHVLLSTLMFFNTKHFNLTTVDEHMQLSFSHIMKHWKRNPNQPGASKVPGSRNVLLRFYPPQSAIQNNARKKKVYEQQENEENPLRCPVKLYEFYLSKCPESVKTRNDVFYLQPERSCVPDSPVWYSTMPLPREALEKMLHRVKMVKEINVALLTS